MVGGSVVSVVGATVVEVVVVVAVSGTPGSGGAVVDGSVVVPAHASVDGATINPDTIANTSACNAIRNQRCRLARANHIAVPPSHDGATRHRDIKPHLLVRPDRPRPSRPSLREIHARTNWAEYHRLIEPKKCSPERRR